MNYGKFKSHIKGKSGCSTGLGKAMQKASSQFIRNTPPDPKPKKVKPSPGQQNLF